MWKLPIMWKMPSKLLTLLLIQLGMRISREIIWKQSFLNKVKNQCRCCREKAKSEGLESEDDLFCHGEWGGAWKEKRGERKEGPFGAWSHEKGFAFHSKYNVMLLELGLFWFQVTEIQFEQLLGKSKKLNEKNW